MQVDVNPQHKHQGQEEQHRGVEGQGGIERGRVQEERTQKDSIRQKRGPLARKARIEGRDHPHHRIKERMSHSMIIVYIYSHEEQQNATGKRY
jgi:hypothetical protein